MEPKTVEIEGQTYIVMGPKGGPIYVDGGEEREIDVPHTVGTITRLNGEAASHRKDKEALQKQVESFAGIDDPEAAKKALETVKNLDDKQLVDAGEVERVKQAAIAAVEEKYKPYVEKSETLQNRLHNEIIGGRFSRSDFIKEKIAVPADMVQSTFGKHFSVGEDGRPVAKDAHGNVIMSKSRPGEQADFDEALGVLVEGYAHKDHILKGDNQSGTGANRGQNQNGSGTGAGRRMRRTDFDKLSFEQPDKAAELMRKGEIEIVE